VLRVEFLDNGERFATKYWGKGRIIRGMQWVGIPSCDIQHTSPPSREVQHHPKKLLDHTFSAFGIAISGTSFLLAPVDFLKRFN
jgi:hypothetical protein